MAQSQFCFALWKGNSEPGIGELSSRYLISAAADDSNNDSIRLSGVFQQEDEG